MFYALIPDTLIPNSRAAKTDESDVTRFGQTTMADNTTRRLKRGDKYCVAGGPDKVSCQNTSFSPGIPMHCLFDCKPCDVTRRLRKIYERLMFTT